MPNILTYWSNIVKRLLLLISLIILISCLGAEAAMVSNASSRPVYAPDLVKIQLSAEAAGRANLPEGLYEETARFNIDVLDRLMDTTGGTAIIRAHRRVNDKAWEQAIGFDRWFLIRLNGKMSVEEALAAFKANPLIQDTCFEHYAYAQVTPNDNYYAQNWGHNNTGQGPGGGGAGFDSNAPEAWDQQQGFGSPDIIIGIIDSGVNYNHADLDDNCIQGYDYGSNDNNPIDGNGHGTSCAGVAAGETNNGIGVAGVAGGCKIMPIKVMDNSGNMSFTSITNAITHAADNDVNVISMSLGAEAGTDEGDNPACDAALYYAYNAGCVILAATANSNTSSIAYPSNHTAVISVGAASPTGQRKSPSSSDGQNWWGSNYGVNIQDDPKAVDIMAATILPATTMNGSYSTNFNGTSCATPYAAGVAALILSKDSGLTPAQVRQAIVSTATDMTIDGGAGWDRYTGYGLINADAACASVSPGMPTCVITAPPNHSTHDLGSTIQITVTASDQDGTISHVNFFIDDSTEPSFTDNSAPYEWTWDTQGLSPWDHTIRAVAYDNLNNSRESNVTVTLLLPANEGFESGQFNIYPWDNTSATPWTIQSSEVYSGTMAAKAGAITHNQNTSLSLVLNVTEAGEVSFFSKVSCENNYDYFRFFIDGAQQEQWTGSVNWARHSYNVAPGQRTFTWNYVKDQGVNSGSDTAWLDHIIFPAHNAPPFAPTNLTATALSPSKVGLHWTDNSPNETEFYIEENNGGFWSLVDWAMADVTSSVLSGLTPLTTYSYRVKAYNNNGSSSYSNIATVTTLGPDCPDNVIATADFNRVNLSWTAPTSGSNGYEVWRYTIVNGEAVGGVNLTPTTITELSYQDTGWHLQEAGEYLWKIRSLTNSGYTSPSSSNTLAKQANGVLLGSVTDLSGTPINGVEVNCGTLAVTTNEYGVYYMSLVPGDYTITASHADYDTMEISGVVVASEQQTQVDFQLPMGTVATPAFAPEPGTYNGPVDVAITCSTDGAVIRYTLDGNEPTEDSPVYTAAIHLTASTTVIARAFKANSLPSESVVGVYDIIVANDDPVAPAIAGIQSIYPNPFTDNANIRIWLKEKASYNLSVYNLRGELVHRLKGSGSGPADLAWNGRDSLGRKLGSGIYLIRLRSGDLDQIRKIVLK
jgi:subtilisin family serine protease